MKQGSLVKCDPWVYNGSVGIIVEIQDTDYCRSAWVLLDQGIKLIRTENLEIYLDEERRRC